MSSSSDYALITSALKAGDVGALNDYAAHCDNFPFGNVPGFSHLTWIAHTVDCGSPQALCWMLAQGCDPNEKGADGFTLLQLCIDRPRPDRYEMLTTLLAAGANIDRRGSNDWTALHHAACRDDYKAIRILIDAGADRTVRTRIDLCATAEEEARHLGHLKSADLIRDHQPPTPFPHRPRPERRRH